MRGKLFIIICFIGLIACSEEDLPAGLYDYQVERLLSGQSGTKAWAQVISTTNCTDSVKLLFELVTSTADDSLDIARITRNIGCTSFDTTQVGRASASSFSEGDLFTDSLIFASGDFWKINLITSQILQLEVDNQRVDYQTN